MQENSLNIRMESTRQQKIARLIQKDLGAIFQLESRSLFGKSMVTITVVRVSPDLSSARIYLSIFGAPDKNEVLKKIKENSWQVRKELGKRIGKQVRVVPDIDFFIDDSLDEVFKIEKLLKK